jgi:hypothetical protein
MYPERSAVRAKASIIGTRSCRVELFWLWLGGQGGG